MATVTASSITSTSNLEKLRIELNNLISDVTNVDSSINSIEIYENIFYLRQYLLRYKIKQKVIKQKLETYI